jgi:hypothetical protein
MGRFAEKWGKEAVKQRRWEELKGLLEGWEMRAESAKNLDLSEKERENLKCAVKMVKSAILSLEED